MAATPSYNRQKRSSVIGQNLRPLNHPYFTEYVFLQKLCLQILRREELKFGKEKDKVYGVLFDGAWLWEEYLATLLPGFTHAENKTGKNPIYLFSDTKQTGDRYPDYYKNDIVLDAKYRPKDNIGRDDIHQIISYMYVLLAKTGGFIFPCENEAEEITSHSLNGYGNELKFFPFHIPQAVDSWQDFRKKIQDSEQKIKASFQSENLP